MFVHLHIFREKVEIYVSNVVKVFQSRLVRKISIWYSIELTQAILERELSFYRATHAVETVYVTKLVKSLKDLHSACVANIKGLHFYFNVILNKF